MTLSPEERDALRALQQTDVARIRHAAQEFYDSAESLKETPGMRGLVRSRNLSGNALVDAADRYAELQADHARLTVALQVATEDSALLNRLEAWLIERPGERSLTVPREDAKSFTLFQCDEDSPRLGMKRYLRNALRAALPTEDTKR